VKSLFLLLPFLCAAALAQQQTANGRKELTRFDSLKDGDLVFIASSTDRAGLIQKLTHSEYSHCGIIFRDAEGKARVYEGAGANSDTHKTINQWQEDESTSDNGVKASPLHKVYARRLTVGLTPPQIRTLTDEAAKLHHTPYDRAFQMGDPHDAKAGRKHVYCSELIYRAFQSIGIELGTPRPFRYYYDRAGKAEQKEMDHQLNSADVNKIRSPEGPYRQDEFVISPEDVYVSDRLEDVADETSN
jgi:cell wall-associated NlpC family hydrolase